MTRAALLLTATVLLAGCGADPAPTRPVFAPDVDVPPITTTAPTSTVAPPTTPPPTTTPAPRVRRASPPVAVKLPAPQRVAPSTAKPARASYRNCAAVRNANADPIRRGDPGYGQHLDRDGDGVGCE
jgi:hypothetical protein